MKNAPADKKISQSQLGNIPPPEWIDCKMLRHSLGWDSWETYDNYIKVIEGRDAVR